MIDKPFLLQLFVVQACLLVMMIGGVLFIGYVGYRNNGLQQQRIEYQRQHLEIIRQHLERDNRTATYKLST